MLKTVSHFALARENLTIRPSATFHTSHSSSSYLLVEPGAGSLRWGWLLFKQPFLHNLTSSSRAAPTRDFLLHLEGGKPLHCPATALCPSPSAPALALGSHRHHPRWGGSMLMSQRTELQLLEGVMLIPTLCQAVRVKESCLCTCCACFSVA